MKMMKETNDVKNKEELIKEKEKESEPKDLSSNSKDINDINSGLSNININSEQSKLSKKEIPNVNKDLEIKNKLEIEDNQNINKNTDTFEKANLDLSPLDEKSIINNNKSNTPIKPQSSPLNFQLKKNANFQMKSRKNTYTESDYHSSYQNLMNIKSPIYSYFDQDQKYLSANYNGENYFNYSENKANNNNKNLTQEEIPKKIKIEENSENQEKQMIKTDKSMEHENESMNYNDFNLFNSPDNHDSSQVSAGLNNIHTNKMSRKSSQATASYKRVNSQNNFIYTGGGGGESDNIDFNMDMHMNESIDENSNNYNKINNEEIKINKDNSINNHFNNIDNLALINLGNPWLNIKSYLIKII